MHDEKSTFDRGHVEAASFVALNDAVRWSAIGLTSLRPSTAAAPASHPRGVSFRVKRKPSVVDVRTALPVALP